MTQAEGTRTIKYVLSIILAESSRWLLHRRRDTEKINIPPGCRKKIRKQIKTKSRKQGTKASKQASKKIVLKASP